MTTVFILDTLWDIMKEHQPHGLTELEQKLGKIDSALGKASRVSQAIGTPEFGRPELDISPSSQLDGNAYLDAAIRVGRVRKALTENAIPKLTDLKGQVQVQINDLKAQNEKEEKLQQIRELVDAGYIPTTVLEKAQVNIRAQKEVEETKLNDENLLPKITILPDRKVRLSDGREIGGKQGELLRLLANTSEQNPKQQEQLVDELWPKAGSIYPKTTFYHLIFLTRKELVGSGLRLVTLMPWEEERVHGKRASYYLKSEGSISADGIAAETATKETSFRKSKMLKVKEALHIDMAAYLREEYETKEKSLKNIAQDITDKTNGQIRIAYGDVYRWLEVSGIKMREFRNYMEDPLKKEAALQKQAANMQNIMQKRSNAELTTLKAKFGENPKEALENLYITQGFSIKRIAEIYELSEYTLKKWFKRFEIPHKDGDVVKRLDILNRARILGILTILEDRERQVLEDHSNKGKTLEQIGADLGITKLAAKYLQRKALSKLTEQLSNLGESQIEGDIACEIRK